MYKFSVSSSPFRYKKRFRCSVARRLWGLKNRYSLKEQRSKEREFNFYICVSFVTPILVNAVLILYSTPQRRVGLYYITFLFIIIL